MSWLIEQFKLSKSFYCYLLITILILSFLSYKDGSSFIDFIPALFGILYVFYAGYGKVICFYFGCLYSSLYAYVAYTYCLYGDMMLNIIYLPINVYGIINWGKHISDDKNLIIERSSKKEISIFSSITIVLTIAYAIFLEKINANFAFLNSFIVIAQLVAFYMQVKRKAECYVLLLFANLASILMWCILYLHFPQSIPQLITTIVFLVIGIIYLKKWWHDSTK